MLLDDDIFSFDDAIKPIDKNFIGILNIFKIFKHLTDKSEKKKDASKSFEMEIFDLVPDGILVTNLSGFVVAANKAYYDLTGYTKDQIIGKHALKMPALKDIEEVDDYWAKVSSALKGEEIKGWEFKYRHADGSLRWGEARGRLAIKGLFRGEAIAVLRDITDRKNQEALIQNFMLQLKESNLELERSNRELDDYTFAVSHDLKAPLRTIDSFSNFLLDDYADRLDDVGKEYLLRIRLAAQRMKTLIDDLLTISRIGRKFIEFEPTDLNELIESIIKDNEIVMLEYNCEIIYDKLPTIKTQKVWIKQVFSNLISNGFKFNKSINPTIWINYEEKEDVYLFSVKDNGIGIDKKHEDKLFTLFQRLHTQEEYPGSGAGLTICKKVIESLGGKIWFESEINKGTTFYFTILKNNSTINLLYDQVNGEQINNIKNSTR